MDKPVTQWMTEPLRKYATFTGRARRKEYWWFGVFVVLAMVPLAIVDTIIFGLARTGANGAGPLTGLFVLAIFLPSLAVGVRRLHDRDLSGWFLLVGLIPLIGGLILLYQNVQRGSVGDNRFGPDPVA